MSVTFLPVRASFTALLLALVASGCAGPTPVDDAAPSESTVHSRLASTQNWPSRETFFTVWRNGTRVGWARQKHYSSRRQDARTREWLATHRIDFELHVDPDSAFDPGYGRVERREFRTDAAYGFRLVYARFADGRDGVVERDVRIERGALGYVAEVLLNGVASGIDLRDPSYSLVDALAPSAWLAQAPAPGTSFTTRDLDLVKIEPLDVHWEVTGRSSAGLEARYRSDSDPAGARYVADADGTPVEFELDGYTLRRASEEEARGGA